MMARAPVVSSSWSVKCFAAPFVASGMKNGVSTIPCAVVSMPARAS